MWPPGFPLLKMKIIKWLLLFFFNIRFKPHPLKEKNFLRKRKIGLGIQISLLPKGEKKQCLNLYCKGQPSDHQVVIFFPCLVTLWPRGRSTLNYEDDLVGIKFLFFLVENFLWLPGSPLFKEEKIKWLLLFFFNIRFRSCFLKRRNFLRKRRIGLGTQISLLHR